MACKHQAAVARAFNIYTVGLVPFHSREARHTFAILARGEGNTMDTEFYIDLRSKDNYSFTAIESSLMPCSQHFSYDLHAKAMQLISLLKSLVRTEVAQVAGATFKHLG